jgi:hypothetical protein
MRTARLGRTTRRGGQFGAMLEAMPWGSRSNGVCRSLLLGLLLLIPTLPAAADTPALDAAGAKPALVLDAPLDPSELPEGCRAIRAALADFTQTLEAALPADQVAGATQHVAVAALTAPDWNEFAGAMLLMGDADLAAWAGLKAAALGWSGETVGNAGTYLLQAGREEARGWLLCAREMGFASPYLLEAIAVAQEAAGDMAGAREAINEAHQLDAEDPMIEIEHAFLNTGEPPPPARLPTEPLERCYAELERHAHVVYAQVAAQQRSLDRVTRFESRAPAFANAWEQLYQPLLDSMHGLLAAEPIAGAELMQYNQALVQCVTYYFSFTMYLLDSVVRDSGTELTFWAQAMHLDPMMFVRDTTSPDAVGPILLARLPSTSADRALDAANAAANEQYWADIGVCSAIDDMDASNACRREATRRECQSNLDDFDAWAAHEERNYNTAAQRFDGVAVEFLRWTEATVGDARDFAARTVDDLRAGGPTMTGIDNQPQTAAEMALWQINISYATLLLEPYLTTGDNGADDFIAEQAQWFGASKQWFEAEVEGRREDLLARCGPVLLREALEALAEEEWQAYRDELWANMMGNVQASWDAKIKCEASVDGFTASIDSTGAHDLSGKWRKFGASLDSTGKLSFNGSWKWLSVSADSAGNATISGSGKWNGVSVTPQVTIGEGHVTGVGLGGSAPLAPGVTAKGSVTLASDHNPNTGRSESSLAFSGSLKLGVSQDGFGGISCTPGSGSVKIFPRAFTEAAVRYALSN